MKHLIAIIILIGLSAVWLSLPKIDESSMFSHYEAQDALESQIEPSQATLPLHQDAVLDTTTFTAYNLLPEQTDDTPCIGAGNNNLCELKPILKEKGKIICASRDLPLDTEIYIEGYGVCVIKDRLNIRYKGTYRVDILMDTYDEAINFGIRKLKYKII